MDKPCRTCNLIVINYDSFYSTVSSCCDWNAKNTRYNSLSIIVLVVKKKAGGELKREGRG